jgi:hypothetical protein
MVVTTQLFKLSSTRYQTMVMKVIAIKCGRHSSNWQKPVVDFDSAPSSNCLLCIVQACTEKKLKQVHCTMQHLIQTNCHLLVEVHVWKMLKVV